MTHCPLCQKELVSTQPEPKSMRCPDSHNGLGHLFEYLCYGDDINEVHHYTYKLYGWQIDFWPPNPNYPNSKRHLVIRFANNYNRVLYSGPTDRDWVDFPKIKEHIKMLALFS